MRTHMHAPRRTPTLMESELMETAERTATEPLRRSPMPFCWMAIAMSWEQCVREGRVGQQQAARVSEL